MCINRQTVLSIIETDGGIKRTRLKAIIKMTKSVKGVRKNEFESIISNDGRIEVSPTQFRLI